MKAEEKPPKIETKKDLVVYLEKRFDSINSYYNEWRKEADMSPDNCQSGGRMYGELDILDEILWILKGSGWDK